MAGSRKPVATTTEQKERTQTKFEQNLVRSNSEIRAERGRRISETVGDAQAKLIMDIKGSIRKKKDELESMMDLSTDNTNTSMNVISKDFDADSFVERINSLKTQIRLDEIKLEIAEETNNEWFA